MRLPIAFAALPLSLLLSACGSTVTQSVPAVVPTDVLSLGYNGKALTVELPASPTPASYGEGYNFTVAAMATFSTGDTCADGLEFYTNPLGGGGFADTCIQGLAPYIDPGVQLFTGPVTNPTFVPGTYNFNVGGLPGVLTIVQKNPDTEKSAGPDSPPK